MKHLLFGYNNYSDEPDVVRVNITRIEIEFRQ